jgi:lysophospholipase L1-like esterase
MPLGDSITSSNAYRRLLWKKLQLAGYQVDFIGSAKGAAADYDTDHEGHSGWEAGEVEEKISGWLDYNTPDIVMLHIGTNDLNHGQSNASTLSEINGIIERIRKKNSSVIILLAKIIPIRHLDTSIFNHQLGRFAEQRSTQASPVVVVVVDQASGYDAFTDNIDALHPNKKGEEKIANKWFVALQEFLSQ